MLFELCFRLQLPLVHYLVVTEATPIEEIANLAFEQALCAVMRACDFVAALLYILSVTRHCRRYQVH